MGWIGDITKKVQDKIAETGLSNEPRPENGNDILQGLKNLFINKEENQFTQADWENFKNKEKERTGTKVSVTKIDAYNDTMVFFLRNEDSPDIKVPPIIYPCFNGNPALIESIPLEDDKLIIERDGIQLPIVYNLSVHSYFISDFVDVGLDYIFKSQGITENMLHLREQFSINSEPNFLVRHIRQGVFVGVSSLTNMINLPIGFFQHIRHDIEYFQYCRKRQKASFEKAITGQLVFSQIYSTPTRQDLKQHTIYIRLKDPSGQLINCYFNKELNDYFDTPPDNSEVKVTGKVNILDGSFELEQILYGNYDIIKGKDIVICHGIFEKHIDHFVIQNIQQKIKIALRRYPTVWNANNPPAPVDVLFYSIWGTDVQGKKHMAKMINPIGILPDWDEARVDVRGEFAKGITGTKTGIIIKEGNYDRPGGQGPFNFVVNTIAGEFVTDKINCRLAQHKVFKLKDAVQAFRFIKTPQYDPSKSYIPTWRFDENDHHFFIIEAKANNYQGFYTAYKKGVLNASYLLNEELLIEGGINKKGRIIQINTVNCHGANLTSPLTIPFRNTDFRNECSIHGKVINVEIETINSSDYKNWLFQQSNWFRKDDSIKLLKFYYNLYANQNHTFDFLLPVYYLDIRPDNIGNNIIKCLFRPMWFDSEFRMLKVNPIPLISIDDTVQIQSEKDKSGYYKIKSILNKTNNTYGVSVIDTPENDIENLDKALTNNINENEFNGVVASDMRILYFGINPENFDFLKGMEYFSNQHENVYNILPQQVIFTMRIQDGRFISCMAPLDLVKGFNGIDYNDERIPMQANLRIIVNGKYSENGVFEINAINRF